MRMRHAAVVAGLALGFISGAARAATLEYNVLVPFIDGNAITGTINTDYKAGVLSSSDIVSYDLFYAGAEYSSSGSNAAFQVNGNSLIAVGNALQFHFDGSGSAVNISGSAGNIQFLGYEYVSLYSATNSSSFSLMSEPVGTVLTIGTSEGTVSAVPLPASASMFGAALLALSAVGYSVKCKKAAAQA